MIKENYIPPWRAGPLARVYMEKCYLTLVGSRQNQVKCHLGGLTHFPNEQIMFLKEFLREGEISPWRASPPSRASSPPYKQPLNDLFLIVSRCNLSKYADDNSLHTSGYNLEEAKKALINGLNKVSKYRCALAKKEKMKLSIFKDTIMNKRKKIY